MKLGNFLWDKSVNIIFSLLGFLLSWLFLQAFKVETSLKIALLLIYLGVCLLDLLWDYLRKYHFYHSLLATVERLDKKYLVSEMIEKPNFYEGQIFYQVLYEINKSFLEEVNDYKMNINDFKDYVEMWIHEVKIPIASLILLNHNHEDDDKRYGLLLRKLDNAIDQILYYVRSENAEKDYIIKEKALKELIKEVAIKNKDDLLLNKVNFEVKVGKEKVLTDAKWLEFILNQIINNAIKYRKIDSLEENYIKIEAKTIGNQIILSIWDNGIGIAISDIPRLFDKSFTGENGRMLVKSTGMGLYIAKKLCDKLGHKIEITSVKDEYTLVTITFYKNDFYMMED